MFVAVFAVLLAWVFGPFLLATDGSVPSHRAGDMVKYTAAMRAFLVDELLRGHFPLWNPHTFSGTPFVGVFQSAALHPSVLLYLALPLALAVTLDFVAHLLLLGVATFAWLRRHGHAPLGAGLAALVTAFGAGAFMRVASGQFQVLGTIAWMPLLLVCVEHLIERPTLRWVLAGAGVTAVMALAGHPPTLFMAGMATGAWACVYAVSTPERGARGRTWAALACVPILAVGLSAAQLFTGLEVAAEGVRQGGGTFEFATTYSMPPEGLLSLLVPELYTDISGRKISHWGRWFYWDTSAYMGIVGLLFAVHGAIVSRGAARNGPLALTGAFTVLALGRYTPVYGVLFALVPGFALFRAPSKLMFFAALFAAPLVATGVDRARRSPSGLRFTSALAAGLALVLAGCAVWALRSSVEPDAAHSMMRWLAAAAGEPVPERSELERWRGVLVARIAFAAVVAAAGALLLSVQRVQRARRAWPVIALVLVGSAELTLFAARNRMGSTVPPETNWSHQLALAFELAGDDRVLMPGLGHNMAVYMGGRTVWGYDPIKLDRYAQFVARSQGFASYDLDDALSQATFRFDPALRLVRARVELHRNGRARRHDDVLPRLLLVDEVRVVPDRAAALDAVFEPGFDPRRTVILEQPPDPAPAATGVQTAAPAGSVRLVGESTDHLDVEVELERAAVLLITDAYARGWTVRPLGDAVQGGYALLPADATLRAVPLAAGTHALRLEYAPTGFRVGLVVSLGSLLVCVAGAIVSWRRSVAEPDGAPREV